MDEQAFNDRLERALARTRAQSDRVKRNHSKLKKTLSGEMAVPILEDSDEEVTDQPPAQLKPTICLDKKQFNDRMADSKAFNMEDMRQQIDTASSASPANGNGTGSRVEDDTKRIKQASVDG